MCCKQRIGGRFGRLSFLVESRGSGQSKAGLEQRIKMPDQTEVDEVLCGTLAMRRVNCFTYYYFLHLLFNRIDGKVIIACGRLL